MFLGYSQLCDAWITDHCITCISCQFRDQSDFSCITTNCITNQIIKCDAIYNSCDASSINNNLCDSKYKKVTFDTLFVKRE